MNFHFCILTQIRDDLHTKSKKIKIKIKIKTCIEHQPHMSKKKCDRFFLFSLFRSFRNRICTVAQFTRVEKGEWPPKK